METWWSRVVSVLRGHIPWAECWSFEAIAGIRVVIMAQNFGALFGQAPLRLGVLRSFQGPGLSFGWRDVARAVLRRASRSRPQA